MSDGAARLCALLLDDSVKLSSAKQPLSAGARAAITDAYSHLTSRSPSSFWTSGQWMTERGGGSDVGEGTRTIARLQPDGSYKLFGFKCAFIQTFTVLASTVRTFSVAIFSLLIHLSLCCLFVTSPFLSQGSPPPRTRR